MLSNLIATTNLTTDSNDHNKWLANVSQEMADNVKILSGNVWNTYWHDGTNMMVESPRCIEGIENPIIILKAGVYNDEIKKDILENINPKAIFWE